MFPDSTAPPKITLKKHELAKVNQYFDTQMRKKREYLSLYADRVREEVAKDYRVVVAQEMWFNLIKERLSRNFYRTNAQLMKDLDQIKMNAI